MNLDRCFASALCLLLVASCGDSSTSDVGQPSPDALGALSGAEMISLGPGPPAVHLSVRNLVANDGEQALSRPFEVGADWSIGFLPLSRRGDAELSLSAMVGDQEKELWRGACISIQGRDLRAKDRVSLASKTVRASLGALVGKQVRLAWRASGGLDDISLAFLRLGGGADAGLEERPDVLFVCSDTHRYDYAMGPAGEDYMPFVNEALSDAVRYHSAYTTASWTLPSIASALSGLHPRYHGTGLRTFSQAIDSEEEPPPGHFGKVIGDKEVLIKAWPEGLATVPERLHEAGYTTFSILSNPLYLLSGLYADGNELVLDAGVSAGDVIVGRARELLDQRDPDRPLFLLAHFMDVHQWQPWYTQEGEDMHTRDPQVARRRYRDSVEDTDVHIESLLALWDRRVGLDQSLVVFYSDHGESLGGEDKVLGHGNSVGEELLHIPLMVSYPAKLGIAAQDVNTQVGLIDLFPTVLEVAGLSPEQEISGRSLLELTEERRFFYSDYQLYGDELSTVRYGADKLILNHTRESRRLEETPGAETPAGDLAERLEGVWKTHRDKAKTATAGLSSDHRVDRSESAKALEALGYFTEDTE